MAGAKSSRRSTLEVAAATLLLLFAAFLLFRRIVYEPDLPPGNSSGRARAALTAAVELTPEEAVVVSVTGSVERARGSGEWSMLAAGDRLQADESIRTAMGARAHLRIGDQGNLAVTESTQVTIRELTRAVHRFRLDRGRLAVDYKPDGERVLKIEGEGAGAVAETHGARFSVLSTGSTVAVATELGSVKLRGAQGEVVVAGGQAATVHSGESPNAPDAIAPVPVPLLLKVAGTIATDDEKLCTRVSGSAGSGAEVLVDGLPVKLDREGRFSINVPRTPKDKERVLVAMRDAAGREQSRAVPCDPLDPRIRHVGIDWDAEEVP